MNSLVGTARDLFSGRHDTTEPLLKCFHTTSLSDLDMFALDLLLN